VETSAKQRFNIDLAFHELVLTIRRFSKQNVAVVPKKKGGFRCSLM